MDIGSNGPHQSAAHSFFQRQGLPLNLNAPEVVSPAELVEKAEACLRANFGEARQVQEGKGYAYGALGLLAQHTSYYDGFAVVLSMHQATAVAIRPSDSAGLRVAFDEELSLDVEDGHTNKNISSVISWHNLVSKVLNKFLPGHTSVDVAIASTVPVSTLESFIAALSIGLMKAIFNFQQLPVPDGIVSDLRSVIKEAIDSDFSKAFLMVSMGMHPGKLCIIDTKTNELIPFDAPARDKLSWALIEVDNESPRDFKFYHVLGEKGRQALSILQKDKALKLSSFRDVQHEDLPRVLNALPQKYRIIVRHLVNENKRVQVMIGAIRNGRLAEIWRFALYLPFVC